MKYKVKFSLGLLIFFLLVGIYFLDEYLTKKNDRYEDSASVALFFKNENCTKLELKNEHGEFVFVRKNFESPWQMTEPKNVLADQDAVNNMLVLLRNISIQRKVKSIDTKESGLETPKITFKLTFLNGTTKVLDIGNNLATNGSDGFYLPSAYAKSHQKPQFLIVDNSSISWFEENTFDSLRSKHIIDFALANINGLQISNLTDTNDPNSTILLKLNNDDEWISETPISTEASAEFITQYLQYLQELKTQKIIDTPSTHELNALEINLKKPAALITLEEKETQTVLKLPIYMSSAGVFIKLADDALAMFELDEWANLVPPFKAFRDRSVFLNSQCSSNLGTLTAVDIIDNASQADLKKYGLTDPQKIFYCDSTKKDETSLEPKVLVGNRVPLDEKNVYLKRSDSNNVYIVDTELLSALADSK